MESNEQFLNHEMQVTVIYKYYEVIHSVRLIHYTWYDVIPLSSIGNIRQNHWTMTKGQRHEKLHGCIAAAALKGICYLIKYKLPSLKGIHQN